MWANWYDTAGPSAANVNVDGVCTPMTLAARRPTAPGRRRSPAPAAAATATTSASATPAARR
ncbi:MAG: hypothetical protein U0802_06615 [Candidatus Binatia bacterium]